MTIFIALIVGSSAFANENGRTGSSTNGCTCHGMSASSSTSASFTTSATTVAPGDVVSVDFIVGTTVGTRTHAGLNVSATGGSLVAGSNNQKRNNEITHTQPEALTAGSIAFNFTWVAPTAEGSYSLRGAGNAVDNDGSDRGDAWQKATNVTIIVDDGCDDLDADGFEVCDDGSGTDCNDADDTVWPGAPEACDGIDHDCDGLTLENTSADATEWYLDADADGFGDDSIRLIDCSQPTGYVAANADCNDSDSLTYPFATYTCTTGGDCGFAASPYATDAAAWYRDVDADGYGNPTETVTACDQPVGYVAPSSEVDCDDSRLAVHPNADESCNLEDDDCDGLIDEEAVDQLTFYEDFDADGYGSEASTTTACSLPPNFATLFGDCNDADAEYYPSAVEYCAILVDYNCDGAVADEDGDGDGSLACEDCADDDPGRNSDATELCNGVDDNCDGAVDEGPPTDAGLWFADLDGDGFGDAGSMQLACEKPGGYSANDTDCDDVDGNSFPGAPETCDGVDDDCNGMIDDNATDAAVFYADADADGAGSSTHTVTACNAPEGYLADASDCDDSNPAVSATATETCNTIDDNCDGQIDESSAVDASTWYADTDADGFGDATVSNVACVAPAGFVANTTDCDDGNAANNPNTEEIWYNEIDENCDGNDADRDLDGFLLGPDCNDDDPEINPLAVDTWYDGIDSDCDGGSDFDLDGDGFDSETYGGSDCNDADATVFAGAEEIEGDGVENDCDLQNDHDRDDDGYDGEAWGGNDCDDANPEISPGSDDEWYDGVDSDCDGSDDFDQDHDGVAVESDCDDLDREVTTCADETGTRAEPKDIREQTGCFGSFGWFAVPLALLPLRRRNQR